MSSISANQQRIDTMYLTQALRLAREGALLGEVPVGAVVVRNDQVLGIGMNRSVVDHDPTAHAEVQALKQAARACQSFRLDGATLYVTLEPCLMCCGALLQARISRLVFAAREPRTGAVVSTHQALHLPGITHHVAVSEGTLADDAKTLMQDFFRNMRD